MKSLSRMIIALALLFCAVAAIAQTSKGTISGTVTDTSGAVVPEVKVTATAKDGGEIRNTTTGPNGQYRIEALIPGTYALKIVAKGFSTLDVSDVVVTGSTITSQNFKLQVGNTSDTVTVEANAAQVQTESGDLAHTISSKEVSDLPINNLNPISLVLTQPGVLSVASRDKFTNGTAFSVNGTRPRANNFLIDGQDNNDTSINGQALQPQNSEAVGEVVILANSYAAEFGRGGGSVTNVITKSGTNDFHGAVWDTLQNNVLDTIDASQSVFNPSVTRNDMSKYRQNTYGFAFGGPVKKNKLYFFGAGQWDKYRASAIGSTITLPTDAGFQTLSSLPTNPRLAQLLQSYGSLRGRTGAGITNNNISLANGAVVQTGPFYREGIAQISDDRQINARVDWVVSDKSTLSFRYIIDDNVYTPDFANNGSALPGFDTQQGGRKQNFGIQYTRAMNSKMVNEFRFSFGRMNIGFNLIDPSFSLASIPYTSITGLAGFGVNSAFPQGRLMNTFQTQDGFSFTWGNHNSKIGADLNRAQVKTANPINLRGTLTFTDSIGTGESALQNYIDDFTGATGGAAKVFGSPTSYPFQLTQAYYAQDTWKLRPNFTLDYGIRYEYYGTPLNVLPYPAIDLKDPFMLTPKRVTMDPDYNNFAPRVGIAYTPHFWQGLFGQDKTVIRAGYGLFYDSIFNNITINVAASSPNVLGASTSPTNTDRGLANAFELIPAMAATYSPTASVSGVASNLVAPITHQWNFDIQRELPGKFILTTAYVGTRGIRLYVNDQLNPSNPANRGVGTGRYNTSVGSYGIRTNGADSVYHGFNTKLDRRYNNGLQFRAAYTWSKLIDTGSEVFTTTGATSYPQNSFSRAAERGLAAYDRRHRLVLTYVYDIAKIKSQNGLLKGVGYVTNGWQVSGTTTFQTGAPDTLYTGFDTNGDGSNANDRPTYGNPNAPVDSWAVDGKYIGAGSLNGVVTTPTAGVLYNGSNYQFDRVTINGRSYPLLVPVTATDARWLVVPGLGNVGRNTFIGEGLQNWDFAITRSFHLSERHVIDFRTEMYNAFNHPNEGTTSVYLRSAYFMDPWFTRSGARNLRFKLKYSF